MSGRMKKQAVCLQMLIKTKNAKLRKAILEHADSELIRALGECLCRHTVATSTVCVTKGTRGPATDEGDQGTRGPALLAPLAASVVIPLLRQLFA